MGFVCFVLFFFGACFETLLIHLRRTAECDVDPLQRVYSNALLPVFIYLFIVYHSALREP